MLSAAFSVTSAAASSAFIRSANLPTASCPCLVSDINCAAFISSSGCLLRFRKDDRIRSSVNTGTVLFIRASYLESSFL